MYLTTNVADNKLLSKQVHMEKLCLSVTITYIPEFIFRNYISHENEAILMKSISDERK